MIIFDLDGTLWDSSQPVADSWNQVFREYESKAAYDVKFPNLSADDIRAIMGKTMEEIAMVIMPDMDAAARDIVFKKCETFEVEYIESHGASLYPDVRETLKKLISMGHKLAIVSNCQEGYVRAFIKSMHMQEYFCDYEEWGRTLRSKGENIRMVMERQGETSAVYVGDTQKDKDAAANAQIPFIWAAYGFGQVDAFDGKLSCIKDLPEQISKINL